MAEAGVAAYGVVTTLAVVLFVLHGHRHFEPLD